MSPWQNTRGKPMATMLETLRAKRENGEIKTGGTSAKITGEGHFTVQVTEAKWNKNRAGDAEQGRISFKVIGVRKDTPENEIGSVFSEYVSLKNVEMAEKKYLQISDWLCAAGVKDDKLVSDDDEGLDEAMRTLVLALQKYCQKKEITCECFRKASEKTDSKGRPYFNTYFDDPFHDEGAEEGDEGKAKKGDSEPARSADAPVASESGVSPYKKTEKAAKAKHAVEDDED